MLVLSRKSMQSVTIGSDIRITVIRLEGNQVRIGIEAPRDVRILRDELVDAYEEAPGLSDEPIIDLASVVA
ncbi:MAG: carbon storage regulator [Paludisphaera borealis]|uniref:carbon storage regulator n=1 Tax=Paludisphaera borealis TaxID=1387353 RepID=UPI00283E342E|nr:carbon storage regulator [Paludisphaera borealis]MDR3619750.1 carbon storage regulator [Paludisphaera borealis]